MGKISKIEYTIDSVADKRIVLLTDIHYYSYRNRKKLNRILEVLRSDKFDYICISGDFIDVGQIKDMDCLIEWFKAIAALSKVFVSLGGHDVVKDKKTKQYYYNEELYDSLKKIENVYILDNDVFVDGDLRFIGLTLPLDFYYKYKENTNYFMRYVNNTFDTFEDKYNILLCHTPVPLTNLHTYEQVKLLKNIPLVLSGHTHAGIVPLFLRNKLKGRGIFAPCNKGMFPKDSYGLIKRFNTNIVISSGVTKSSHSNPFTFVDGFFDVEITYINLKRKSF